MRPEKGWERGYLPRGTNAGAGDVQDHRGEEEEKPYQAVSIIPQEGLEARGKREGDL